MQTITSFCQLSIVDLIAIDDGRLCKGHEADLLRQEIATRFNRMCDRGGTTLSFLAWKEIYRSGRECDRKR